MPYLPSSVSSLVSSKTSAVNTGHNSDSASHSTPPAGASNTIGTPSYGTHSKPNSICPQPAQSSALDSQRTSTSSKGRAEGSSQVCAAGVPIARQHVVQVSASVKSHSSGKPGSAVAEHSKPVLWLGGGLCVGAAGWSQLTAGASEKANTGSSNEGANPLMDKALGSFDKSCKSHWSPMLKLQAAVEHMFWGSCRSNLGAATVPAAGTCTSPSVITRSSRSMHRSHAAASTSNSFKPLNQPNPLFAFSEAHGTQHQCITLKEALSTKWRFMTWLTERTSRSSRGRAEIRIFNGLRVRMGMHSGVYTSNANISVNTAIQRVQYSGAALKVAKAVGDGAHGGSLLMSKAAYEAVGQLDESLVLFTGRWIEDAPYSKKFQRKQP